VHRQCVYLGPVCGRVLFQLLDDPRLTSVGVEAVRAGDVNAQVGARVAPQNIVHLDQNDMATQPGRLDSRTDPRHPGADHKDICL